MALFLQHAFESANRRASQLKYCNTPSMAGWCCALWQFETVAALRFVASRFILCHDSARTVQEKSTVASTCQGTGACTSVRDRCCTPFCMPRPLPIVCFVCVLCACFAMDTPRTLQLVTASPQARRRMAAVEP